MSESPMSPWEKCKQTWYIVVSIFVDCGLFAIWFAVEQWVKWIMWWTAHFFGPKYALEGEEYWLFLLGVRIVYWGTFTIVIGLFLTDVARLALYCLDQMCTSVAELWNKFFRKEP